MSQATNAKRDFRHHFFLSTEKTKNVFYLLSVCPASAHQHRCQMWGDRTDRGQTKIKCASRFDTSIERVGHRTQVSNLEKFVLESSVRMIKLAMSIRMTRAFAPTCSLPSR